MAWNGTCVTVLLQGKLHSLCKLGYIGGVETNTEFISMPKSNTAPIFTFLHPETGDDIALPAKFEVCTRCEGAGSHVNPSIDGHGISAEQMAEDPEFAEDYFAGVYDITCSVCGGERVVPRPDLSRWSFSQKRLYVRHLHQQEAWDREDASEAWLRRAESGGAW